MNPALPARVIAWYGDDFTGSTDVLDKLAPNLRAVLFLRQPDDRTLARFSDYAAFGLAGSSRSQTPEWMDKHLTEAFAWLATLGCSLCHYKVCSTFDSSPRVGNIGRAIEIGKRVFASRFVPLVVGVPALQRYTVFGNLFAAADGNVCRIDRHPTMKCHPVTPMREADLRLHLNEQTDLSIGLLDVLQLKSLERYRAINREFDVVLIDVLDDASAADAGHLLWHVDRQPFVAGSSGVEYALMAYWRARQLISEPSAPAFPGPADRIVVLSGSCSPVTQKQIAHAGRTGFALLRLEARKLAEGERSAAVADQACRAALESLSQGRSVVLFTAASPEDRIETFASAAEEIRFRQTLSERVGEILNRVVDASGVRRVVVAGGDTSSCGGRQLGIDALTFVSHMAPGVPLCRAWSQLTARQGLEIVFKGGQMGQEDFFELALHGRS